MERLLSKGYYQLVTPTFVPVESMIEILLVDDYISDIFANLLGTANVDLMSEWRNLVGYII